MSTLDRAYFVVVNITTGRCLERIYSKGTLSNVPNLYETERTAKHALLSRHKEEVEQWRIVPIRLLRNVMQTKELA
jgi:hypothetical protein